MKYEDRLSTLEEQVKKLEKISLLDDRLLNNFNERIRSLEQSSPYCRDCGKNVADKGCEHAWAYHSENLLYCLKCYELAPQEETPTTSNESIESLADKFYQEHRKDSKPLMADMKTLAMVAEKHYGQKLDTLRDKYRNFIIDEIKSALFGDTGGK